MELSQARGSSSIVFWLVAAMLAFGVLALVNVPPIAVDDHAFEKHGTQATNAIWQAESGACVEVWRSVERRRVIRLVISDPLCAYGIVQALSGTPCTAFYAPRAYWAARLIGYERIGQEGYCRD
jgi:hypothetical protein